MGGQSLLRLPQFLPQGRAPPLRDGTPRGLARRQSPLTTMKKKCLTHLPAAPAYRGSPPIEPTARRQVAHGEPRSAPHDGACAIVSWVSLSDSAVNLVTESFSLFVFDLTFFVGGRETPSTSHLSFEKQKHPSNRHLWSTTKGSRWGIYRFGVGPNRRFGWI